MTKQYLLLTLLLVFLAFGYTTQEEQGLGKIYLYEDLLIRSNPMSDITIYDFSNPANFTVMHRIEMVGNHDVAIRGNYMYADRYNDLVVFDISNRTAPVAIDTLRNVFDKVAFFNEPNLFVDDAMGWQGDEVGGMAGCAGCSEDVVTEPRQFDSRSTNVMSPTAGATSSGGSNSESTGKGGSMARFAIIGDYLYCINSTTIHIYNISSPDRPQLKNSVGVTAGIETLFPYENNLFIGGQNGMYIYSLDDHENPKRKGEFEHRRSCDPVVVEDDIAYVTLRGGGACGGANNQLDIIDVSNLLVPKLKRSVPMTSPYGLAVRDQIVMLCDGKSGLKFLDTRDVNDIRTIAAITDITPYDVIPHRNLLIVTAVEGVFVYDISDMSNPTRLTRLVF